MITGELKNKIDRLWEIFWTGGLTNPLSVIEQITYLMFIRDLGAMDAEKAKGAQMLGVSHESIFENEKNLSFLDEKLSSQEKNAIAQKLRWPVFKNLPPEEKFRTMSAYIFPFIKNLHADSNSAYAKYMGDAMFMIPTAALLDKIISALDEIDTGNRDTKGDLYEYLLSKLATAGTNGQFRTPRHIIRMMCELIDLQPGDTICDPACGTSGFLVGASEVLRERFRDEIFLNNKNKDHFNNAMFHGFDMDRTMLRIGAMNMMTHGIENPHIEYRDSLSKQNEDTVSYSKILANPPFKGSLDYAGVSPDLLLTCKTKKTELLFLALFLRMLRVGGRCAAIVPDGVLFGSSTAHKAIRKEIVDGNILEAVISMPSGVFKPYAGVSTAILIFKKTGHGGTENVWFYDMTADGFSLDDKRAVVAENDIPDILFRWKNLSAEASRERTEKSFFVPVSEIRENAYDLSVNKYKKTVYTPEDLPDPVEVLAEIEQIEKDIVANLAELRKMIG